MAGDHDRYLSIFRTLKGAIMNFYARKKSLVFFSKVHPGLANSSV